MALEAVVFHQDPFGYASSNTNIDWFNSLTSSAAFSFSHGEHDEHQDFYFLTNQTQNHSPSLDHHHNGYGSSSISDPNFNQLQRPDPSLAMEGGAEMQGDGGGGGGGRSGRPARRRRGRSQKNKEEIENQRMTHITVERNRRRQMNEYLSVLRSLMPDSYVQRGDQASIIGGAINFVKELEQQVHLLSAQTYVKPFPEFSSASASPSLSLDSAVAMSSSDHNSPSNQIQTSIADIEVSMADSHANLKIRCKKFPKQLLKIVSALHALRLSVLHLNVSTAHHTVLYSFSLKVEEDCGLSSVDDIARAVYQSVCRIQGEAFSI